MTSLLQRLSLLFLLITPIRASILVLAFATPNNTPERQPSKDNVELIRIRGRVAYDGNGFKGFQIQSSRRTIQGALEEVLSQRFQRLVRVVGASRTDAGVHARGQAIHFDLRADDSIGDMDEDDLQKLQYSMNSMLQQDIRVYNLEKAPFLLKGIDGTSFPEEGTPQKLMPWNAIHDSIGKLYIYRISAAKHMYPLERHTRYDLKWRDTDVEVLERTLKHCEGFHDFRAFAAGIEQTEKHMTEGRTMNTKRTVYSIKMVDEGQGMYRVEVRLRGALYKMVRNMIGTALDVSWGLISEETFLALLQRTNGQTRKQNKSKPAPPEGLTLEKVYYEDF